MDVLSAIVASTRQRIASLPAVGGGGHAITGEPCRRPDGEAFVRMLSRPERVNVIAECKRRSPSCGVLRGDYDPSQVAAGFERAGASAVSVITEPEFFDGSLDDLRKVRGAVALPVLRKDFIVDERQLIEAVSAGADAVLLIVAALSSADLRQLLGASRDLGLAALVEVRGELELDAAVAAGAAVIGVNARDLRTLQVAPDTLHRLAPRLPGTAVRVAESGIRTRDDIERLREDGYQAFLVGEQLLRSPEPEKALVELIG